MNQSIVALLTICSLLVFETSSSQSIHCLDKSSKEEVEYFTIFLNPHSTSSPFCLLQKDNLQNYIDSAICISSFGFADTCFILKPGKNSIELRPNYSNLNEIEISTPTLLKKEFFANTIKKFRSSEFPDQKDTLTFQFNKSLLSDSSSISENWEGSIYFVTNSYYKKKKFSPIFFSDFQKTSKILKESDLLIFDSLNYLTGTATNINNLIWINESFLILLEEMIRSSKQDNIEIMRTDSSIRFAYFIDFKPNINASFRNEFIFEFDNYNRLTYFQSKGFDFFNPLYLTNKHCKVRTEIRYTASGKHTPLEIHFQQAVSQNSAYYIEYNLKLIPNQPTSNFNGTNNLPISLDIPASTWAKYKNISQKVEFLKQ